MKHVNFTQAGNWRLLLLLLPLLVFSSWLQAQVTITGKVTAAGNTAAPNVSVIVKGTSYGASTDAEGQYALTGALKAGKYAIVFS